MFSAFVAAVKCRPVLHHCVVILISDHELYLFTFETKSFAHALHHCQVIFFRSPRIMGCISLHLKTEFRLCAKGRQWCGMFHYQ